MKNIKKLLVQSKKSLFRMFYYVLFGRKHSRRTTDQNWKGTKLNFGSEKNKDGPTGRTGVPSGQTTQTERPSVWSDHPDGATVRLVRPPGRTGCPSGQTTQTEIRSVWLFPLEFGLDMNMKVVDNRTSFPMPPVLHQSDIGAICYVKNTKLKRFSTKPFIRVSV